MSAGEDEEDDVNNLMIRIENLLMTLYFLSGWTTAQFNSSSRFRGN